MNTWKTKAGAKVKVSDLTDEHLKNILRMIYKRPIADLQAVLEKRAKRAEGEAVIASGSDWKDVSCLAYYEAADEYRGIAESPDHKIREHFTPQLPALEAEARRRKFLEEHP